jgi:hypothetical protein
MIEVPLISVIFPGYSARPWIAATLRSVLAQDVGPLQVVVDDGSQDAVASSVTRSLPVVQVLQQPHAGVTAGTPRRGSWPPKAAAQRLAARRGAAMLHNPR